MLNELEDRSPTDEIVADDALRHSLQNLVNECCAVREGERTTPNNFSGPTFAFESDPRFSDFLGRMAHEFRLPLSNMLGYANWLRECTTGSADMRQVVDNMQQCGEQLATLIDDVAEFARIESGEFFVSASPTDVRRLLHEIVGLVQPTANSRDLRIVVSVADRLPERINLDASRVRQVLLNLIVNALRFTDAG